MNNTDPAIALQDDQCVLAQNAEWIDSMLGERRKGTDAIDLTGSDLATCDRIVWAHRHLPTSDEADAQLWLLGITDGTPDTATLAYKDTSWHTVTVDDAFTLDGVSEYRVQGLSLHGKLFIAYNSAVDRLHVWDGTALRRCGIAQPSAAPTAADTGSGSFTGTRYYRTREIVKSGATILRRSEPSEALEFSPSGSGSGASVTKPADTGEDATHWELEASLDNANFYVLATTVVGTSSVTDTQAFGTGYSEFELSEDIGDYDLIPSARYLTHDEDRLMWAGNWEDDDLAARVGWTPVFNADGVGNDERLERDTDPTKDLDTYEGGPVTGISAPTLGGIWVSKVIGVYKLTRSGKRTAAYDADKYTDALGGLHGSMVAGLDAMGRPCVYLFDQDQGPCRIGVGGIMRCGEDLRKTWETLNPDATALVCSSLYYPLKKQVYWNLAVDDDNTPTTRIVLHVDKSRDFADGVRKGWAIWTGTIASALTMCLFAENIDDDTDRSSALVPFIGLEGAGLVHRCDTGTDDDGTAYAATITTKPYTLKSILHQFIVHSAALLAKAVASSAITVKCVRDFALETTATVSDVSLAATASETDVITPLDDLGGSELKVVQFQFVDVASPAARWELNQLVVREEAGQAA